VANVSDFADRALGKTVVRAKDTPGFLANRVGTFWIQQAINAAIDLGLTVEEADAVVGKPMGVPKTGVFGLVDLVGIDLMPHLKASLTATLPVDDAYRAIAVDHPLIMKMIADGYTGRKGKGGFYRLNREAGKRKEAIDLPPANTAPPPSRPRCPAPCSRTCARWSACRASWAPMPGPCWGRRWPTPPRWCRRRPTISSPSMWR
jgi:3-hydroxyacyl-CoA dehydrogenase